MFKRGGGRALADEMRVPFLGSVPIDPEIVASGDAGMPFAGTPMQGSAGNAFADIVRAIMARQEQKRVTSAVSEED
jgi:ATP-binding protein involved in chromosome partitioning